MMIMQVIKWTDDNYLVLTSSQETGLYSAYLLRATAQTYHEVQTNKIFYNFTPVEPIYSFLGGSCPQLISIIHVDAEK